MSEIVAASMPVFGLLACLFLGFIALSSESGAGERMGYMFFAAGVAWLIVSGAVLWPEVGHATPAPAGQLGPQLAQGPARYAPAAVSARPAYRAGGYPAPQYAYRTYPAWPYPYRSTYPYHYGQPYGPPYGYWR